MSKQTFDARFLRTLAVMLAVFLVGSTITNKLFFTVGTSSLFAAIALSLIGLVFLVVGNSLPLLLITKVLKLKEKRAVVKALITTAVVEAAYVVVFNIAAFGITGGDVQKALTSSTDLTWLLFGYALLAAMNTAAIKIAYKLGDLKSLVAGFIWTAGMFLISLIPKLFTQLFK